MSFFKHPNGSWWSFNIRSSYLYRPGVFVRFFNSPIRPVITAFANNLFKYGDAVLCPENGTVDGRPYWSGVIPGSSSSSRWDYYFSSVLNKYILISYRFPGYLPTPYTREGSSPGDGWYEISGTYSDGTKILTAAGTLAGGADITLNYLWPRWERIDGTGGGNDLIAGEYEPRDGEQGNLYIGTRTWRDTSGQYTSTSDPMFLRTDAHGNPVYASNELTLRREPDNVWRIRYRYSTHYWWEGESGPDTAVATRYRICRDETIGAGEGRTDIALSYDGRRVHPDDATTVYLCEAPVWR